jgi:transposase-like protein
MEENVPQGFTIFSLPLSQQRRLRTSNAHERLNQEIKPRTRVSLPLYQRSLLRLVSAILCEIDGDWVSSKIYLNINPTDLAQF